MPKFETPDGATPIDDADGLLIAAENMADLSAAESENVLKATTKRLGRRNNPKRQWLTEELIRTVHAEMYGDVWEWAGRYRDVELTIGVPHHRIREEIKKLCDDIWFWDSEATSPPTVVERACRLHHRLAWIHPFRNGNGRHARLISDIYLHAHGQPLPTWPSRDIAQKGGVRDDYLAALRAADKDDFEPLAKLLTRFSLLPEK
jgi:Fic-DOC domain mobile mystery protein B